MILSTRDLIVLLSHPREHGLLSAKELPIVGVQLRSQFRLFCDWQLLQRTRRLPQQYFVSPVHVLAADSDHACRQATDAVHQRLSLPVIAQQEVEYNIGREAFDVRAMRREVVPVTHDAPYGVRQHRLGIPAMKHRNIMTLPDQIPDHERSDKPGSSND